VAGKRIQKDENKENL